MKSFPFPWLGRFPIWAVLRSGLPDTMTSLTPEEREQLQRRLDELNKQLDNLDQQPGLQGAEKMDQRLNLTQEWVEIYRSLHEQP